MWSFEHILIDTEVVVYGGWRFEFRISYLFILKSKFLTAMLFDNEKKIMQITLLSKPSIITT